MFSARLVGIGIIALLTFLLGCNRNEELSMQPTEGYPMLENQEEIRQLLADKCLDTIRFSKGEVVADIGAGNGYLEAMLAMFHDSLTFYIQDIDNSVCNQAAINEVVKFYESVAGRTFNCSFIAINGNDTETCLPDIGFDRILMLWTYHYLKKPAEFITDVRSKLKDKGLLYLINPEQDYEYGLELRDSYGWNGFTIEQQIDNIIACGFVLIRFTRNYEDNQQPYMMVFQKN
ncbi:MAG: class I SAM-dependent methyltransferase [Bacteroidales bacterium]|nr:class I SAM-dependent methyltransferase [Bacteroidales bacterium]